MTITRMLSGTKHHKSDTAPITRVAIHGEWKRGWMARKARLSPAVHTWSRPVLNSCRPAISATAIMALKIAAATARLIALDRTGPPTWAMKAGIGDSAVTRACRSGAPTITASTGPSWSRAARPRAQKITGAIRRGASCSSSPRDTTAP